MEIKNYFAQDTSGNIIPNAQVLVYQNGTQIPATGLKNPDGSDLENPFNASVNGQITFAAPDGVYDLRVVGALRDYTIKGIQLLDVTQSKADAAASATAAQAAKSSAESARDAAQLSAGVYPSTSEGLAATTDGKYFNVISGNASQYVNLYRNNAGTAVLEKTYPSAESVDDWQRLVPGVFLAYPHYEYSGSEFYFKANPGPATTSALYIRGGYLNSAEFTYDKFKADLIGAGVPVGCAVGVTSPSGVTDCVKLGAGAYTVWYVPSTQSFILSGRATRHNAVKIIEWDYDKPAASAEAHKVYFQHAMQEISRVNSKVDATTQELDARIQSDDSTLILQVVDDDGNVALSVKEDEIHTKELSLTRNGVVFGAQSIISTDELAFAVLDEEGFFSVCIDKEGNLISTKSASDYIAVGEHLLTSASDLSFGVIDDEGFYGVYVDNVGNYRTVESSSTSTFQADEIAKLNTEGLRSLSVTDGTFNTEVARPVWDYNHFLMYGQSLSTGQEGWPALSKVARHGNLMLGGATRPVSGSAAAFTPVGASILQPLISVVQSGASVLTDAQVAALAAGDQALGEDPLVGMVNFAKLQHNQRLLVSNDTSRVFVASSAGVSGTTIEQLSAGASPNMFLRLVQAAEKVKSIATASGKSYGIVAVVFLQGEYNYDVSFGGDTTKDGYKAKLSKLYDDIEAQVKTAISGQTEPPIFITYQTGAQFTRDDKGLAIGMAQLELSRERRNWYLASPAYPYTDKGGHMDSNGYRWLSKQFGKVWARVVEQGRSWKPLSPIVAQVRSDEVLVSFHVPSPPLAFDNPYANSAAVSYPNKGFEVLVNGVSVGITSVQIVADTVVRIRLATSATGVVEIRYAGKTAHQGNGSLRDSDQTVADDVYTYAAGTGQYPAANIPSLVDKPYPLHNWCVAFQITATPT